MAKISVCILTKDDADNIADAVASVRWADEIVVVDNGSTDRTVEIANGLGVRVERISSQNFGEMRNLAAQLCSNDWVFSLDADERCPPALRDEIVALLAAGPQHDGYRVPRRNYMMGRWINGSGWYPNYRALQLFRKDRMRYTFAVTHEDYELASDKPPGTLSNDALHFPYRTLDEVLFKTNLYSTLGAQKLASRRVSMGEAFSRAVWAFLKHYIFKLGFRDGWAGFVIALSTFEGTFYRYAKACEAQEGWADPKRQQALPQK